MRTLTLLITPELDGRNVKNLLERRLKIQGSLVSAIKMRENGICINGIRCRTTDCVHTGDILTAEVGDLPSTGDVPPLPPPGGLILFEDEDYLVINKPAGVPVHGNGAACATVMRYVLGHLGAGAVFHPVNRLDKGTSGLMLAAKSRYSEERIRGSLHTDDFIREYLLICRGIPPQGRGVIDLPLKKAEAAGIRRETAPDGAASVTEYETLCTGDGFSLVKARLLTGRTHQIRAHFSAVGCPLAGDALYGTESDEIARPALHSYKMSFLQPITGERHCFELPLPDDMADFTEKHKITAPCT